MLPLGLALLWLPALTPMGGCSRVEAQPGPSRHPGYIMHLRMAYNVGGLPVVAATLARFPSFFLYCLG